MTPRNMRDRKDEMRYRKRQRWDGVSLVYVLGAKVKLIHFISSHNYTKVSKYHIVLYVMDLMETISLEMSRFQQVYGENRLVLEGMRYMEQSTWRVFLSCFVMGVWRCLL